MSDPKLVAAAFVGVVLVWVGLAVWNQSARARLDRMGPEIGAALQVHAAPYFERGELPPPAYWDFQRGEVVEYPPGVAEVVSSGDDEASSIVSTVVRADAASGERLPLWMWGLWVGAVPPILFHGLFGLASAGLLGLWLRLRAG